MKNNSRIQKLTINLLLLLLILSGCITFSHPKLAASIESTPAAETQSPTPSDDVEDKIKELKEKVAEKVSELKEKEKRIAEGEIIKKDDEKLTIAGLNGEESILTDDDTKYYWINTSGKILNLSAKDFVTTDYIFAVGTYSRASKAIDAQFIYGRQKIFFYVGTIKEINTPDTLIITDSEDNSIELNLTSSTDYYKSDGKEVLEIKSSQLTIGDLITVRGYEKKQKLESQRIMLVK